MLYHFTSEVHLPRILETRKLIPTESNIDPTFPNAGPKVVWLTDTPTAEMGHGLLTSSVDKTAVRFAVEVPAIPWAEWAWTTQMPKWWRDAFVEGGGGEQAVLHWFVWPAPIPQSRWLAVEKLTRGSYGDRIELSNIDPQGR